MPPMKVPQMPRMCRCIETRRRILRARRITEQYCDGVRRAYLHPRVRIHGQGVGVSTTGKHDVEPTALERPIEARLSRRDVLAVALRGVASVLGAALGSVARAQPAAVSTLRFAEIAHARSD